MLFNTLLTGYVVLCSSTATRARPAILIYLFSTPLCLCLSRNLFYLHIFILCIILVF